MVILLNKAWAVVKLIRLPNLIIIVATQVLLRQCLIVPMLKQGNMEPQLPASLFILLVLATVLISAGGYAINDYFDRKIDRINKPQELIVGNLIYPRHAMAYHLIFTLSGVVIGTWVAFKADEVYLSLIFFIVSGLLWFYSTTYKQELILGNVIIALLTALVPLIVMLFELPLLARNYGSEIRVLFQYIMIWVLGFSLFAFLLNLIREIVKDAEDFEGDHAYGKRTIPVIWGIKTARWISIVLIAFTIAFLILAWVFFVPDMASLLYFLLLIVLPLIFVAVFLWKGGDQQIFHKASTLLKIIMITGVGYTIAANLIINYMK